MSLERPVACNSFNPRRTRRLAVSIVLSVIGRRPVIVSPLYANNRCSKNVARVSLLLGVACLVALRVAILAESLCTGAPRGTAPIPVTESLASTDFPFGGCRHPTRLRNADSYQHSSTWSCNSACKDKLFRHRSLTHVQLTLQLSTSAASTNRFGLQGG